MIRLQLSNRKLQTSTLLQSIDAMQEQAALDLPDQKSPSRAGAFRDFQTRLNRLRADVLEYREKGG